jgi:Domain of unknown function (DUF4192)
MRPLCVALGLASDRSPQVFDAESLSNGLPRWSLSRPVMLGRDTRRPSHVAAPASLLAFCAWQAGDGALANVALDRALDDNPLAELFRKAQADSVREPMGKQMLRSRLTS